MVAVELFWQVEASLKTIAKMLEVRTIDIHGTKSVANGKMISVFLEPLVINEKQFFLSIFQKYSTVLLTKVCCLSFFNIFVF